MVRVLQIVTKMDRGGLETMLMNYYRQIDRNAVQFDFLVHRTERGAYDDEIESLGGNIYRLPRLNPLSSAYYKALDQFFTEHKGYRIVHSHLDCMSAYPLRTAKKAGIPIRIAHAHSTNQDKDWKYLFKWISKGMIPWYATSFYACSKKAGKWMFGDRTVTVLPNAINTSQYRYNQQVRICVQEELAIEDEIIIGHVGRFSPVKNHAFLVDVFQKVKELSPRTKLLLVGNGDEMSAIQEKVNNLGMSGAVMFTGLREDVDRLLQAMDIFVFPSLYEGLGIVAIEAQAAGLPCVISDKVPTECIITEGLVDMLPLTAGTGVWARQILSHCTTERTDHCAEIAAHGFDITNEAGKLQEFYIHAYEQNS